jgi:hypothetical protein
MREQNFKLFIIVTNFVSHMNANNSKKFKQECFVIQTCSNPSEYNAIENSELVSFIQSAIPTLTFKMSFSYRETTPTLALVGLLSAV